MSTIVISDPLWYNPNGISVDCISDLSLSLRMTAIPTGNYGNAQVFRIMGFAPQSYRITSSLSECSNTTKAPIGSLMQV
ncbi:hypothetical protein TNCT_284401 [Trichonephila clavata]|uniref:Uncharacterized protein n=1 Tax=Trichonephila clavata TaxID=2740835 RepID=A0A8X6I1P0_TRICU|nr:hypothetical protein TNCT_284401 [Trichonephila clavata]